MCVTQRCSPRVPDEIVRHIKYRIMQIALFISGDLFASFLRIRSHVRSNIPLSFARNHHADAHCFFFLRARDIDLSMADGARRA